MNFQTFYFFAVSTGLILSSIEGIFTLPTTVTLPVSVESSNSFYDKHDFQKNHTLSKSYQIVNRLKRNFQIKSKHIPKEILLQLHELKKMDAEKMSSNSVFPMVHNTRLKTSSKITVDPSPIKNYYPPDFPLSTACWGSSIPYGNFQIMDWIRREVYKHPHLKRPFYRNLRIQMYFDGNSEECHTLQFYKFRDYLNCAVLRNQRMEFNVPKYPMHQKDK